MEEDIIRTIKSRYIMADTKKFVDGLMFKKRNDKAPEWIRGHASIKVAPFTAWLAENGKNLEWINLDLCKSKDGEKLYFVVNEWKPTESEVVKESSIHF